MNSNKNIWIGIVVVALVVGAYYFGTTSKGTEQSAAPSTTQETSTPAPTPQKTQTTTNSDAATNSSWCAEMANKAAQDEEDAAVGFLVTQMQVTQSHIKNGQCYYELSYHTTGGSNGDVYETQINEAPNNTEIAYCGRSVSGTACFGMSNGNSTTMSAAIFHSIETDLLTN